MAQMLRMRNVVSRTLFTPLPSGCRAIPIPWEANAHQV